jgi:hypothetical protein
VYALGGLIVAAQPFAQIVIARLSSVTFGLIDPGVRFGSGSPTGVRVADGVAAAMFEGVAIEAVGMAARGPGSHRVTAKKAMPIPRITPPRTAQPVRRTD